MGFIVWSASYQKSPVRGDDQAITTLKSIIQNMFGIQLEFSVFPVLNQIDLNTLFFTRSQTVKCLIQLSVIGWPWSRWIDETLRWVFLILLNSSKGCNPPREKLKIKKNKVQNQHVLVRCSRSSLDLPIKVRHNSTNWRPEKNESL